ncbi:hypothetical protein BH09BAC6_BH09BAC6_16260 [soil metagenome]
MKAEEHLKDYGEGPLTRQLMLSLLKSYKRPNDKIAELVSLGVLTTVKKGLYITGPKSRADKAEPFLIANHLWGPSYVSFETALSYWGYIPERVYEISSVTVKDTKIYRTPAGRFTYRHASLPYYAFGITNARLSPKQNVLIASPEKAICDKITMTAGINLRSPAQTLAFLIEDMRIDEDKLRELDLKMIDTWTPDAPKHSSLVILTKTLRSL